MFKFKFFILFFIFLFYNILILNSVDAKSYNYPYICNNSSCEETKFWKLNNNWYWFYLSNIETYLVSNWFYNLLQSRINDISSYYWTKKFTIKNFYDWDNVYDREFTISQINSFSNQIIVWKIVENCTWTGSNIVCNNLFIQESSFLNWYEYLIRNFSSIIDDLHIWLPTWTKKNKLNDYVKNIIWDPFLYNWIYIIILKNICDDSAPNFCDDTKRKYFNINSTAQYRYILWDRQYNSNFIAENFTVSPDYSISSYNLKAWNSLDFNFWFIDYLDVDQEETIYEYRIYYKYSWESNPNYNDYFLKETIYINQNWTIRSDNLSNQVINEIFDLSINNRTKKIRLWVKEWINLTKSWDVIFYFSARNINTLDSFPITRINTSPVRVLPDDRINFGTYTATITPFTKELNEIWFNHEDTFSVTLTVKDSFWNNHYDFIDWYDISLSNWSSNDILLAKIWEADYSSSLVWVKSSTEFPYYINFRIKIPEFWYHKLNWFNLTARPKSSPTTYSSSPIKFTLENIIPPALYDWEQLMNIFIKPSSNIDFPIPRCTSWSITFTAVCNSDNFSWCRNDFTTLNIWWNIITRTVTFNSQLDNWSNWTLVAIDHAYNQVWYNYAMNHIDQTAPVITIFKWSNLLSNSIYNYKSNSDPLLIDLYEWTAPWWTCEAKINYEIKVNWNILKSESLNWNNNIIELPWFFEESWLKEFEIVTFDNYWNSSSKNITFNIFPWDIDISKSFISYNLLESNNKYANNSDFYNYTINLRDRYDNPVYWKRLNSINQDCSGFLDSCLTIRTDMKTYLESNYFNLSAWNDALIEYNYSWLTTNFNWELNFRIRSLSPWEFSNRFKIILNTWDDNYNSTSIQNEYFITNKNFNSEKNWFKKLFYWQLSASNDDWLTWNHYPEIWTEILYKIDVKNSTSLNPIINIQNFKNYVNVIDKDNTYIQNVSNISWLNSRSPIFSASINTSANTNVLWEPWIEISDWLGKSNLYINYSLGWNIILYPITNDDLPSFNDPIKISNLSEDNFLWVEIIWLLQWWWKSNFWWLQEDNISSISMSETRLQIRRNAYSQIRNMTNNLVLWWVKYVVWNYTMDSNPSYETLIVHNWNLIINDDINISWKTLWIIVLKDNYDVNNDYNVSWNIYVTPNVQKINAILYADWWFISSDINWIPYITNTSERTASLNKQLVLKWSLFTRNTIWWSLLAWWTYILPGWSKLLDTNENFNKSMIYDLNYFRRWKDNCEEESLWVCKYKKWALVIEYDSRIQSKPPKLFSN